MIVFILIYCCFSCCYGYQNGFVLNNKNFPSVLGVSAMCGANGISVSVDFDGPFTGKIYSLDYANVHECIYYNAKEMQEVLFTIPLHRCGTRVTRNTREVIDTVENRVYLQMDKYTQTAYDRQYSFLCELVHSKALMGIDGKDHQLSNEIRRHPGAFHGRFPQFNNNPLPIAPATHQNTNNFLSNLLPATTDTDRNHNQLLANANQSPINPLLAPPTIPRHNFINPDNSIKPINSGYSSQSTFNHGQNQNGLIPVKNVDFNNHIPVRQDTTVPSRTTLYTTAPYQPVLAVPNDPNSVTDKTEFEEYAANSIKVPVQSTQEPIRIYAAQELNKSEALNDIILEIQSGDGPRAAPISKSVKIGERLTLVVKNTKVPRDLTQYNIFVHSCVATDGPGTTKVDLIDKSGCPVGSQLLEEMKRERDADNIIYYFKIAAFKFPGPDDVYFSCLVDMSPSYNFPELCSKHVKTKHKRELITAKVDSYSLFKDIKVNLDDPQYSPYTTNGQQRADDVFCLSSTASILLISIFTLLLASSALSFSAFLIIFYRLKRLNKQ